MAKKSTNCRQAFLRKGLPPEYRPEVWWSILGCESAKLRSPVSYQQYLEGTLDAATSATIECDLPRTFPNHKKPLATGITGKAFDQNSLLTENMTSCCFIVQTAYTLIFQTHPILIRFCSFLSISIHFLSIFYPFLLGL